MIKSLIEKQSENRLLRKKDPDKINIVVMNETYSYYQDGCPLCGGLDNNQLYNGSDYQECDCGWSANIEKDDIVKGVQK